MESVLDPAQLARIERVHRGYLFQHLYAATCLLAFAEEEDVVVQVETDEDVEVVLAAQHWYLQVKWRAQELTWSDISDAMGRFNALRREHEEGRRAGTASFAIVSNAEPDEALQRRMKDPAWPSDVAVVSPRAAHALLPTPGATLEGMIDTAAAHAATVPFSRLPARTLVLKLAAHVQLAATGFHEIEARHLPALFEQVVTETQSFPTTSDDYVPNHDGFALDPSLSVQWLLGPSGAGKTTWAAENVPLVGAEVAYFDVARAPNEPLLTALAVELAAQLAPASDGTLGTLLRPGAAGATALSALDTYLAKEKRVVFVVVDNAHETSSVELGRAVRCASALKWVVLSQPTPDRPALEADLRVAPHVLRGWEADTIAQVLVRDGCRVSPETTEGVRALTSGYPLFVRNVARLATQYHEGDIAKLLSEFAQAAHPETTQQEVILQRTVQALTPNARTCLAALSATAVALTTEELDEIAEKALGLVAPAKARRELTAIAAIEQFGADSFALRDAYRLLGRELLHERTPAEVAKIKRTAADILRRGFGASRQSAARVRNYLRLLGEVGDIQELVDVATSLPEWWREIGFEDEIAIMLVRASGDEGFSLDDRFWATDTLAFFALQQGRLDEAEAHLAALNGLMGLLVDPRKAATIDGKRMLIAGARKQWEKAEAIAREAAKYIAHDAMAYRILRYNLARIQWENERYEQASSLVSEVVQDYFERLQLDPFKLLAKNVAEVVELLPPSWDSDDVKHLADALDLFAHCQRKLGRPVQLAALHASKLFTIAHALGSTVRVGLDAARDFAEGRHAGRPDPAGAVAVLERIVLPYITHERLVGHALEARLLYADLLEAVGRLDDARTERARLAPYVASRLDSNARENPDP